MAVLDGENQRRVLRIDGGTVLLERLVIFRGRVSARLSPVPALSSITPLDDLSLTRPVCSCVRSGCVLAFGTLLEPSSITPLDEVSLTFPMYVSCLRRTEYVLAL